MSFSGSIKKYINYNFMIYQTIKSLVCFLILMLICLTRIHAQELNDSAVISVGTHWESRYITEGRDNLEKGGIASSNASFELSNILIEVWYGVGDSSDYEELNLLSNYTFRIAEFESYFGYSRLEFLHEDSSDNEFNAGISYEKYSVLVPAIDYIYSSEANGSFVELSLHSHIKLLNERLIISPYIVEELDFGFATKKHNGLNSIQFGVNLVTILFKKIELKGYIAHTLAQEDVKQENGKDLTWGGVGISWFF